MKELWVPISGAIAQQRKVEVIANNVANANTPGFKKDDTVFKEHLTVHEAPLDSVDLPKSEWKPEDFYRSYGAEHSFVKVDGTYTNFSQGQLNPTGNPLDLAISGKGMLEVITPNGIRFSRKGNLSLNTQNILVTEHGFPVLSKKVSQNETPQENFQSRFINIPSGNIAVNERGEIFVDGQKVNELSIVEFKNWDRLKKEGNSLFVNTLDNNKSENLTSKVHQGFIENSNVNPVVEMSELIKAHRHFDSIQRAIKTYDSIANRAVNDIAKF